MAGEQDEQQTSATSSPTYAGTHDAGLFVVEATAPKPSPAARIARIRALRGRQTVAVLSLSCAIFGTAAAAFAWTTIRSHDRESRAEASAEQSDARLRAIGYLLQRPDVRVTSVSVGTSADATMSAYYSPGDSELLVAVSRLPFLPAGKTYELWYSDASGNVVRPAAVTRFDTADVVVLGWPASPDAARLLLTFEPAGGSVRPSGVPIGVVVLGS